MPRRRLPTPLATLITYTADRFLALASPDGEEPSPVAAGATYEQWAELAGLTGEVPHESIRSRFETPLDLEDYELGTVAHATLQRLCSRGVVDRVGGLPMRYRPRPGGGSRKPRRARPKG